MNQLFLFSAGEALEVPNAAYCLLFGGKALTQYTVSTGGWKRVYLLPFPLLWVAIHHTTTFIEGAVGTAQNAGKAQMLRCQLSTATSPFSLVPINLAVPISVITTVKFQPLTTPMASVISPTLI